jgi:Immunity protein 35
MNLNLEEAKKLAFEKVNSNYHIEDDILVILDEDTLEKEYGWYFFSASKKFLSTLNISDMVVGNGPILVKKNGEIIEFGTAFPIEFYIKEYEKERIAEP